MPELNELIQQEKEKRGIGSGLGGLIQQEKEKRGLPEVETSPLEVPEPKPVIPQEEGGAMVLESRPKIPDIVFKAAGAGVDFKSPAPSGHFLASLGGSKEDRIAAYKMSLTEVFGQDIEVRVGDQTGVIEYLNPDTNRWSLVNVPGLDMGDVEGAGGFGIVLGSEIAGGLAGGALTSGPAGAIFGAGAGAFVGETSRLVLGKRMGINQNMTADDIVNAGLVEAGIATAGGVVGEKALRFGMFLVKRALGEPAPLSLIENMGLNIEEAAKLADDFNERLGAEQFRFNLAQASLDENLLITQEVLRRSPQFSKQFGAIEAEQEAALEAFWQAIHKPYRSRLSTPEAGQRAIDIAGAQTGTEIARADVPVRMLRSELDTALNSSSSRPFETLGRQLREFGDAEQEAFNAWADEAATALHGIAGGKEFIENRNLHKVASRLDEEVQNALFPSIEKPTKSLLGQAIQGETDLGEPILNKIFDPNARFTFQQAWRAISALKRVERVASKGLSTDAPETGAIKQLRLALERDLRESAQDTPLGAEYDQFILRYAQEKRRLDEGAVGKMMGRTGGRNGRFVVTDENIFRTFVTKGTDREAKELFDLVKNSPEMMQGVRESLVDFYQRSVVKGGRVNMNKHGQFMRDYLRAASVFFTKNELEIFSRPGQIEKALQARELARDRAVDRINKTFTSEVANLNNPGKLLNLIKDTKNPDRARELVGILSETPDALRAVRNEFRKFMLDSITGRFRSPAGRTFSAANFDKFLTGKGGEGGHIAIARNLFGEQYANDLMLLNDVLRRVRAEARTINTSNTAFWEDTLKGVSRTYVGMFTRPGRFVTAIARVKQRFAENILYRTVGDPVNLRELVELRGVDMRSRKARAVLGSLGASFLVHDAPESSD